MLIFPELHQKILIAVRQAIRSGGLQTEQFQTPDAVPPAELLRFRAVLGNYRDYGLSSAFAGNPSFSDYPQVASNFEAEIVASLFTHQNRTVVLDTTGKTPAESFDELLLASEPLVTMGELAVRAMKVPEGEYEVVYERGVRKTVPK